MCLQQDTTEASLHKSPSLQKVAPPPQSSFETCQVIFYPFEHDEGTKVSWKTADGGLHIPFSGNQAVLPQYGLKDFKSSL